MTSAPYTAVPVQGGARGSGHDRVSSGLDDGLLDRSTGQARPPVTVAIVDDNAVIRMGLRGMLATDDRLHIVGEAGDGDSAIALIRATMPDVTLLDVRMPRRDGVQVAGEVRSWTRVLMMSYADSPEVVRAALEAGAVGYLVHGQFRPDDIVATVLSTAAGSSTFSAAALSAMTAPVDPVAPVRPDYGLSRRQIEIMEAISQGKTNAEIAGEFYLAEKTVKNHINQIFARMRVRSRAEAVAQWLNPRA